MILDDQFEGNNSKKKGYHCQGKSDYSSSVDILKNGIKIFFCSVFHMISFLKMYAPSRAIIPEARLVLNIKNLRLRVFAPRGIKAAANHAADRLVRISEITLRKIGSIFTHHNLAIRQMSVNQIFEGAVG